MANRREYLKAAGAAGALGMTGLSGCIGSFGSQPYKDGTVTFLMSPTEEQETMRAQYEPVGERLGKHLSDVEEAEIQFASDYSATLESLSNGTADIAETGPFAAALGAKSDKAEIALQRHAYGGWDYKSVIVTKKDSDISKPADLKGKKIAFADALSASGSLYPLSMLKDAGLAIPEEPGNDRGADFTGTWSSHGQAIEALKNDQADAAGVGGFITLGDDGELMDDLKEVDSRTGIPRAPILVAPGLSDEEKEKAITAFTEAPDEMYYGADGKQDTDDDLWFDDVRKADKETYQAVIDVANKLGYGSDVFKK